MGEQFSEKVEILNAQGQVTVKLDGNEGEVTIGDNVNGNLKVKDNESKTGVYLGSNGCISVGNAAGDGGGKSGYIIVRNIQGSTGIYINGQTGEIIIYNPDGTKVIELGKKGNLYAGGGGTDGNLVLRDKDGKETIHIGGDEHNIVIKNPDGTKVIELGKKGNLYAGGGGIDGDLVLRDRDGKETIHIGGDEQNIVIKNPDGTKVIELGKNGNLYAGGGGVDGDVLLRDKDGNNRIHLDAESGDIKLLGADCAEEFDVIETAQIDSGTVLAIYDDGKLRPCDKPYDKRVAGVVSGGNGFNPGIILDRKPARNKRLPIALVGKVSCKVDAQYSPIEIGDLLTTSPTTGHAMKADDPSKAFGAVIGKALGSVTIGRGLIPILVTLQ